MDHHTMCDGIAFGSLEGHSPEWEHLPRAEECEICGLTGVTWCKTPDGWKLYDAAGRVHAHEEDEKC